MTYILMIWTVVAMSVDRHVQEKAYEWRPIGEFHDFSAGTGQAKCEEAARQLGLKHDRYRCVRSK
jgi:hypothetical protein